MMRPHMLLMSLVLVCGVWLTAALQRMRTTFPVPDAQLLLQVGNGIAEGRLGDMQFFRRLRILLTLRDLLKIVELLQIHGFLRRSIDIVLALFL